MVAVHAVDGMPGVGKTAFAVHAAHLLADRFPDGQIFLDLFGHTAGQAPLDPHDALAALLSAVGVEARRVPADTAGRAALWRRSLSRKRLVVVLDNAADHAQIAPLLPGSGGCLALVTSRRRLVELRALVAEDGELSVAATFDLSYRALPSDAALLYRRLGLFPGSEFDRDSAAALLGDTGADVDDLLERLLGANLLADSGPGRFRFHDLLRLHAHHRAERDDRDDERRAALRAVVESLLDRAVAADRLVTLLRPHLGVRYHAQGESPFSSRGQALDWLEDMLPSLVACARTASGHGWYELVWQLYESMWGVFLYRGHTDEWLDVGTIAVDAAVSCGDGVAAHARGDVVAAIDHYGRSLALNEKLGRKRGVALLSCYLGHALADTGHHEEAVAKFRSSARIAEEIGDRHCWAQAVVGAGTGLAASGTVTEAIAEVRAGLAALPVDEAAALRLPVLEKLADLHDGTGEAGEARRHRQEALEIATSLGDRRADALRLRLEPASRQAG